MVPASTLDEPSCCVLYIYLWYKASSWPELWEPNFLVVCSGMISNLIESYSSVSLRFCSHLFRLLWVELSFKMVIELRSRELVLSCGCMGGGWFLGLLVRLFALVVNFSLRCADGSHSWWRCSLGPWLLEGNWGVASFSAEWCAKQIQICQCSLPPAFLP